MGLYILFSFFVFLAYIKPLQKLEIKKIIITGSKNRHTRIDTSKVDAKDFGSCMEDYEVELQRL